MERAPTGDRWSLHHTWAPPPVTPAKSPASGNSFPLCDLGAQRPPVRAHGDTSELSGPGSALTRWEGAATAPPLRVLGAASALASSKHPPTAAESLLGLRKPWCPLWVQGTPRTLTT